MSFLRNTVETAAGDFTGNQVCKKAIHIVAITFMLSALCGCNGPVRYKTIGFRKSATVELYKASDWYYVPPAVIGGAVADVGVTALDTVAIPFCALAGASGGPDGRLPREPAAYLFMPFWCLLMPVFAVVIPFQEKEIYEAAFGKEHGSSTVIPLQEKESHGSAFGKEHGSSTVTPIQEKESHEAVFLRDPLRGY